jgi:hypothetical protein
MYLGPLEDQYTIEMNYGGLFCGFGPAKTYVDGKEAFLMVVK